MAALIRKRHPLKLPEGADGRVPAAPPPSIDFNEEMHSLRLEVDALLAAGKVREAEEAMEAKRVFLNEHGFSLRKLNQAYFAFYGTYADSAASSNPIGPKIEQVWSKTQDVGLFLRLMREVTSAEDLDALLAELQDVSPETRP